MEEEIKSALELAMERISGLPELTPEEIAAQKEKQFAPFGEALSGKYLSGLIDCDEIPGQLEKYPEDQRFIVRRALLVGLSRTLQLEGDLKSAVKALKGIGQITPEKGAVIEKALADYQALRTAYGQEKQKESDSIKASALEPLGISGTAVRCNPAENPYWLESLNKIRQSYEPKLVHMRSALSSL